MSHLSMIFLLMIDPSIFLNMDGGHIYTHMRPRIIFLLGTVGHIHSRRPKKAGYLICEDTIEGFHPARLCNAAMRDNQARPIPRNPFASMGFLKTLQKYTVYF